MTTPPADDDARYDAGWCDAISYLAENADFRSLGTPARNERLKELFRRSIHHADRKQAVAASFSLMMLAECPATISGETVLVTTNINSGNVGSAIGEGSSVTARDIVGFSDDVRGSSELGDDLKSALIDARQAIDQLQASQAVRDVLAVQLQQLTDALKPQQKDKSLISVLWSGITSIAGKAPEIVKLGHLIATFVGVPLPDPS